MYILILGKTDPGDKNPKIFVKKYVIFNHADVLDNVHEVLVELQIKI